MPLRVRAIHFSYILYIIQSILQLARSYAVSSEISVHRNAATGPKSFEEQQARLKQQIIDMQTANGADAEKATITRDPSFDTLLPPFVSISRDVSWDKDLNGPGERAPITNPIVGPLFPCELMSSKVQQQQRDEAIYI